ncbi:hypothetical protein ACVJBD_003393 [Rhizobium mongolense]
MLQRRVLRPALPNEVSLGTGKLVTHDGKVSPQVDTILYSRSIMPPVLYDESHGLFPAESCLYAIEVKTRLRSEDVRSAVSNAVEIAHLPLLEGEHHVRVNSKQIVQTRRLPTPRPIVSLFAFSSDLTSAPEAELARYRGHDPNADTDPAINVICIVGRGYWYHKETGWNFVEASNDLDEIMQFLAGITNTLPQFLTAKGRPNFGHYLTSPTAKHQRV